MASNSISIAIKAVDQASSVLKGVARNANAWAASVNIAAGAARAGVQFFTSSVAEASKKQIELIATSGNLMFALKGTYAEGAALAKALNNEAVRLGAALPGTAAQYATIINAISNDVVTAHKEMGDAFDLEESKKKIVDIGRAWTLMAVQTKTPITRAANNMMRLIAGDANILIRNAMTAKSVAFRKAMDEVMAAHNATVADWKNLSSATRVEILDAALKMAVPAEAINAMTNTVTGILNTWRNAVFDQTSGILGFLRDLNSRDNNTVMGILYELLASSGELFRELARLFPFQGDPMVVLYDAINSLNNHVKRATGFLAGIQNASATIAEGLSNLGVAMPSALASLWDQVIFSINSTIPQISNSLVALSSEALSSIDFGALGYTIGSGFVRLLGDITASIARVLVSLDYGEIIVALYKTTVNIFSFFNSLFAGIRNTVISRVSESLQIITRGVMSGLQGVVGVIVNAFASLPSMVASGAAQVVANASSMINSALRGSMGAIRSATTRIGPPVPNAAKGFNTGSLMAAVAREQREKGSVMVANTTETVLTSRQAEKVQSAIGGNQAPVININISGGLTSPELIDQIISELGRELNAHRLAF